MLRFLLLLWCALLPLVAGAQTRTPWTTSRVQGSPEPSKPYTTEPLLAGLPIDEVLELASLPDHLLLVERRGSVWSTPVTLDTPEKQLVLDLKARHPALDQLFGLVLHPAWRTNRQVFLSYTVGLKIPDGTRLSRFRLSSLSPPVIDPASEEIVLTWLSGGHNGGHLQFGPDGFLYITTGDGEGPTPPDLLNTGQDNSDLLSAILRIDVDRQPPRGEGYVVPPDNPYVGRPGVRPEIWAFGFRNPWKMSFGPDGRLWCGDVGWELWEMVHLVERGGNYGWSAYEASQPVKPETLSPLAPITPPVVAHPHHEAASITGGYVYEGNRLPELRGAYVYGDYETGKIWALWHDGTRITRHEEIADTPHRIVTFGRLPDGDLIYAHHGPPGSLHRFVPNPAVGAPDAFPRRLSDTGLFADTAALRPAPGVYDFEIAEPLWEDGAAARRMVALPGDSSIGLAGNRRALWPAGSVLARTLTHGEVRVETQLLHFDGEAWNPYSYQWNAAGTDAALVAADGAAIQLADGRSHTFHSRAECLRCHTSWTRHTLGFQPSQLTRIDGQPAAEAVRTLGLANPVLFALDPTRLAGSHNSTAAIDARARSWLHANCAHCHRRHGGGSVAVMLNADLALEQTALLNETPQRGDLGIPDGRLVRPGRPDESVLLARIARTGHGRMPIIGARTVDTHGFNVLWDWIASLPAAGPPPPPPGEPGDVATVPEALRLLRALAAGRADPESEQPALARLARSPDANVAALFERFLPPEERLPRLGPNPDSAAILNRRGDPAAGAALVAVDGPLASCRACHFIAGIGRDFGPDLSRIGARLNPAQLLESLLDPGRTIAPEFIAHTVDTRDGGTHLGFVIRDTAGELVLKLPTGQSLTLSRDTIRSVTPLPTSLMPENLLQDLTFQQAADLIAYLQSLR